MPGILMFAQRLCEMKIIVIKTMEIKDTTNKK